MNSSPRRPSMGSLFLITVVGQRGDQQGLIAADTAGRARIDHGCHRFQSRPDGLHYPSSRGLVLARNESVEPVRGLVLGRLWGTRSRACRDSDVRISRSVLPESMRKRNSNPRNRDTPSCWELPCCLDFPFVIITATCIDWLSTKRNGLGFSSIPDPTGGPRLINQVYNI